MGIDGSELGGFARWLRRRAGLDCRCGGAWGPWERREATCERPALNLSDWVEVVHSKVEYTAVWQERRCLACGFTEQRPLAY